MQHAAIARPRSLIVAHLLLLLAEEPRHGYELAESLRGWEFEGVTASTVYRELGRLEEEGLVQSFWQASQARGPARHMYELTAAGQQDLALCADDVRALMTHLSEFLIRVATVDGSSQPPGPAAVERDAGKGRRRFWPAR